MSLGYIGYARYKEKIGRILIKETVFCMMVYFPLKKAFLMRRIGG
jgi:hypothetical protein